MSQARLFENLVAVYDSMIDWPKRLAHETPFYRNLFENHAVHTVIDSACGVGRHAAMFHQWGLSVEGADISPAMIERAKNMFGESADLHWHIRGFDQPIPVQNPVDAVVCVGNSLPLALDKEMIERAIVAMFAALRSGGLLVVQCLNLWRLPDGESVWQKCRRQNISEGDFLIVKGVHRSGSRGFVDLIVTKLDDPATPMQTDCVPFWGIEAVSLAATTQAAGASTIHFFGGYGNEPYDRFQSNDLIMVATKR